jgi:hypothetical protein
VVASAGAVVRLAYFNDGGSPPGVVVELDILYGLKIMSSARKAVYSWF